ncbi:MAG: hypothetical protein H6Q55_335 [Deltaproteobacteria bacterium]|nr:hypothetical protein [Deltaproteobacteria bacterium]
MPDQEGIELIVRYGLGQKVNGQIRTKSGSLDRNEKMYQIYVYRSRAMNCDEVLA